MKIIFIKENTAPQSNSYFNFLKRNFNVMRLVQFKVMPAKDFLLFPVQKIKVN